MNPCGGDVPQYQSACLSTNLPGSGLPYRIAGSQAPVTMAAHVWRALLVLLSLARLASASDKDLLLALKLDFTNGDALLSSWTAEGDPCDGTWEGITCGADGQVTEM